MLVFDTETRTDEKQQLTFGSYRFIVGDECLEEGLFYADDLAQQNRDTLQRYAETHRAEARSPKLILLTRRAFLRKFFVAVYKGRCLCVGFNLPFDLSRLAFEFTPARGRFAGGFSLRLWSHDAAETEKTSRYRPSIGIKHIDSKRALVGFTARSTPDNEDLIPEGSLTGKPEEGYKFHGHFLDAHTLAFALTDRNYSLEKACEEFGVEHPKKPAAKHGEVTEEYIDYNRRDVLATYELTLKLLEEYDKHPITLQETKAYSPASIGKAYLRAMGIPPILERQPDFPNEYLGYSEAAFFGGRTSAHIRKFPVPVVYTDFLSMYPTVNSLMNLWPFVTAERINVVEHCQSEIGRFLREIAANPTVLFARPTWERLTGFVRIIPNGDVLPSRAKYNPATNDWQVGVNHLHAHDDDPKNALWYSLPDVVVSILATGRVPQIVDAFRIEAHGTLSGLQPTKLRGQIEVDPRRQDFFKVVIEERKRLGSTSELPQIETSRIDKSLKVTANATGYGIYAEMNRQESEREVKVCCHGLDPEPYFPHVKHPDVLGEYCFPPLASLITGAARLMLALLEHSVRELGGTYAMEDTDSMAIVATERGGPIKCNGRMILALSWKQVADISRKFARLSPYDRDAVPTSILKIEDDNFDPVPHRQRQIYCLAISAKRYALFQLDANGNPVLLRKNINNKDDRWSEHGLGHLLNPTDPEGEDRQWTAQVWLKIIRKALGLPTEDLGFHSLPAISRTTVSSFAVARAFADLNEGKKYGQQIKPFNFLLTCHIRAFGHPIGADPQHFHLIAPYSNDPTQWRNSLWRDLYSGKAFRIGTTEFHGDRSTARVKTYGDLLTEYEFHPESKSADADGDTCTKQTVGLLQRRHIRVAHIVPIGKESNSLEDVESGLIHSEQSVYTLYPDPRRDKWQMSILPAVKALPLEFLVKKCKGKLSRRALIDLRAGRSKPHLKTREMLRAIVERAQRDAIPQPANEMHDLPVG
jgi:hypothetical protein